MIKSAFLRELAEHIEAEQLFGQDARIVVGVSGGCDSVALVHGLLGLNGDYGWSLDLHVAHLNHSLRGSESEADAAFVEAAADDLALPRTVQTCDVPSLVVAEKGTVEELARRERYTFFERTALAIGAKTIAVGHHADDNAIAVKGHRRHLDATRHDRARADEGTQLLVGKACMQVVKQLAAGGVADLITIATQRILFDAVQVHSSLLADRISYLDDLLHALLSSWQVVPPGRRRQQGRRCR